MALDGVFLRHIKDEIEQNALNLRVDKVYQPSKEEVVISLRGKSGRFKLLICVRANSPRVHFTEYDIENPKTPPMFCMLLRKKLSGAKIISVRQPDLERLLYIDFNCMNELGDREVLSLAIEIMGKYSNLILIDSKNKIIDSIKRVNAEMSSKRLILPGITYTMPPAQDKICVLRSNLDEILEKIESLPKEKRLSKALLEILQGISPSICKEAERFIGDDNDVILKDINSDQVNRLKSFLNNLSDKAKNIKGIPYMINADGVPIDFSFLDFQALENEHLVYFESFSKLLDSFYFQKDKRERIKTRSHDLNKMLKNLCDRLNRKIDIQKREFESSKNREELRVKADIINANLYRIEKGSSFALLENFYDDNKLIQIDLDPSISSVRNAQKYYKDYQRAKTAENILKEQIEKSESDLEYLTSVLDLLNRAESEEDLIAINEELQSQGYIKKKNKLKQKENYSLPPLEFKTTEGLRILVGRNNKQNDQITLKKSHKNDIWFHTKDIPGSHTILVADGKNFTDRSILEAASVAAYHSKARNSTKVAVDYTEIRYVHKPNGAKLGKVIYTDYKTIYVKPDIEIIS